MPSWARRFSYRPSKRRLIQCSFHKWRQTINTESKLRLNLHYNRITSHLFRYVTGIIVYDPLLFLLIQILRNVNSNVTKSPSVSSKLRLKFYKLLTFIYFRSCCSYLAVQDRVWQDVFSFNNELCEGPLFTHLRDNSKNIRLFWSYNVCCLSITDQYCFRVSGSGIGIGKGQVSESGMMV